jgi:hypothetical protein
MAKAQGKKAAAAGKSAAKKIAARVKTAVKTAAKKTVAKKPAPKPKPAPAAKKPAPKPAPKPAAKAKPVKAATKPVKKAAEKVTKAAAKVVKAVAKAAPKAVAKVTPKAVAAKVAAPKAVTPKAAATPNKGKAAPAVAAKTSPAAKTASIDNPVAVPPVKPSAPVAPNAPEPEKKRGRRARTRITSSGAPAAAWLSTEKPRPASFIPAPPRAEAPSAIAAPPASSDRLIRPEDLTHLAVRTVPVRIDVEQGAGRFYVIASPQEVTLKVGEGIEWDFRYIGGADVTADEVVIEFERPSPFLQNVYRTRKPGGARPHRALSGGALPAAAGKRVEYTVKAMTAFKTEMAATKIWVNISQ